MRMPDSWDSQGKAAERIRVPVGPQKDEMKAIQKRTFTRWINVFLQRHEASFEVGDLFDDIQDGKVLMVLLEELTGCKLLYRFRTPSHRIFKLNNISKALAFLDDRHVKLLGIDASCVADGVPSVVLSLIWNIILHFQVRCRFFPVDFAVCFLLTRCIIQVKKVTGRLQRRLSSSLSSLSSENDLQRLPDDGGCYSCNSLPRKSRKPEREPKYHGKTIRTLLQWVQKCTSKYGVDVHDFGRSWRSGLAFLALIKSINPDLVDLRESLSKPPEENLQQAFTVAHRSLDVPPLLELEDVTTDWPDEQSVITYVSMFLGLWSDMDENQTPDTDVFEIASFGSVQSKETIAEASKAQALLERSSELQLWKRWSRKSSGTSPASASCISPLRALKLPSPLNAKAGDQEVHMWVGKGLDWRDESQSGHESPVSFGSEDGSLSALDSDEEDAYSYILDLNEEAFQPCKVLKQQVSKVEEETVEEMKEELKHMEANQTVNGNGFQPNQNLDFHSEFEVWGRLGLQRNFELNKKSFTESEDEAMLSVANKNPEETTVEDPEGDCHDGEKQTEVKTSTMDARSIKSKEKSSERLNAAGRSSAESFKEEAPLLMNSPAAMRRSTELEITAMVQSGESPLEKQHGDPRHGQTSMTSVFDAASPTFSREERRPPPSLAASCGPTPLELEMLLLLWILLYCFFLLPHMNP